jgi:hypothetical protein
MAAKAYNAQPKIQSAITSKAISKQALMTF